jgi:hypothetical protein
MGDARGCVTTVAVNAMTRSTVYLVIADVLDPVEHEPSSVSAGEIHGRTGARAASATTVPGILGWSPVGFEFVLWECSRAHGSARSRDRTRRWLTSAVDLACGT